MNVLARANAPADVYRKSRFNNLVINVAVGPELSLGSAGLTGGVDIGLQSFGGPICARTAGVAADYLRPLDGLSQVRAAASVALVRNRFNPLESGHTASLQSSYERALSSRSGLAVRLAGERRALRDPGYPTTSVHLSLTGDRELGAMTLIASAGYGRLRADERLLLYPERRADTFARLSLGSEFRELTFGGLGRVAGDAGPR